MRNVLEKYREQGVSSVVFGDVFLEDVRDYRERNLRKVGMKGLSPLWQRDTAGLVESFIDLGFRAVVTCTDSRVLGREFVGRVIDESFLSELPPHVDPSGENGEYHTFVFDGSISEDGVGFSIGDIVLRESFYFCDLLPRHDWRHDAQSVRQSGGP